MNKNVGEILVIVLLIITLIMAHVIPTIAQSIQTIEWDPKDNFDIDKSPKIRIQDKIKIGNKYMNIFEQYQLSNILDKLYLSEEIETDFKGFQRQGSPCKLLKNDDLQDKIEKMIDWESNNHLIYFIKAENGHHIDPGNILMIYNKDNNLKEVKTIWYMFVNLDWKFENEWVFKDINNDLYYAPENNTIIEFTKDCKYEWSPLKSEQDKYFILVYNF